MGDKRFNHSYYEVRLRQDIQNTSSININNKLVGMNETVKIKDKILKNCIKIEGIGRASYNPGPPLSNINITVKKTEWYAPDYGLVKFGKRNL